MIKKIEWQIFFLITFDHQNRSNKKNSIVKKKKFMSKSWQLKIFNHLIQW